MAAIYTFIFWTAGDSCGSKLVIRVTGRKLEDRSDAFSHMGLGFELDNHQLVYFEALARYGFTGPHPIEKLFAFQKRGGTLLIQPVVGLHGPIAEQIHQRCLSWVGRTSYHEWQLGLMWAYERFGRRLGWRIPRSPCKVVCSEAVAELLWPHFDLRDPDHPAFDEVNPNSAYRSWLNQGTLKHES